MHDSDHKYVTFKREDFLTALRVDQVERLTPLELSDAVVIRRQDLFASPALATYASCIGITANLTADPQARQNLLDVADYFDRQAALAADEGHKLPDV